MPAAILAKNPPTILRAQAGEGPAPSTLPNPPSSAGSAPSSGGFVKPNPTSRPSASASSGALRVNTRPMTAGTPNSPPNVISPDMTHASSMMRPSSSARGPLSSESVSRTLYQPTSSAPSKKLISGSSPSMRLHTQSVASSSIPMPPVCTKFISPQFQFATDLSSKLTNRLELTNFTVVGVFGFEGVGKSTAMSLVAANLDSITKEAKDSAFLFRTKQQPGHAAPAHFPAQTMDVMLNGRHETNGIDMIVVSDVTGCNPMILLDTQPMLSSSMLCDLLSKNESPRFGALTPEQQIEVASYQIATFLFSVCHYVVFVHDDFADLEVVRFMQQVEQKLSQCRLPNISGGIKDSHKAKLIYLRNQHSDCGVLHRENQLRKQLVQSLERAWPSVLYRSNNEICRAHGIATGEEENETSPKVPVFALPRISSLQASNSPPLDEFLGAKGANYYLPGLIANIFACHVVAGRQWQRFIRSLPNTPSFSRSFGAGSHVMTLREWLSNASRVLDGIRKSSTFTAEYSARDHH